MTDDSRKRKRHHDFDDNMTALCPPTSPMMARGPAQRQRLSLDGIDLDLELSFASNMSLNSPQVSPVATTFGASNHLLSPMAMDISPAPISRMLNHRRSIDAATSLASPMRKRANTVRSFGRELVNDGNPLATTSASFKEQRSPLPKSWVYNDNRDEPVCFGCVCHVLLLTLSSNRYTA